MTFIELSERTPDAMHTLTALWERSVRITHTFLSDKEIDAIRPFVPTALAAVPVLIVAVDELGRWVGFMGIDGTRIEMLFANPACIGIGLGRRLMAYAVSVHHVTEVTVNEQNTRAVGFYHHMGFRVYRRTDTDKQGRPYPLLYMSLMG